MWSKPLERKEEMQVPMESQLWVGVVLLGGISAAAQQLGLELLLPKGCPLRAACVFLVSGYFLQKGTDIVVPIILSKNSL